ncbi:DNA translocase FtsK [Malaciobacter mytili]|uniref:Cell division protein FtsK n=1 Tax=Malaciobacter mytili LMG 24559 TaxID=1032238 RepID=A0AAX2AGS9_9BACT|nr:DNA segregation ATPase FtsK/SpoIIIE [Malaciobacter mytili LMG 24559]RXK15582.1 cell division protein FtsK [Malaciobacter mytili LMG 24559]
MVKKILSLIFLFIIIYLEFSIFVTNQQSVGKIGFLFAQMSHKYFGYLSYVYLLLLLYPLYQINFKDYFDTNDFILKLMVVFLLLFSSLTLQSLVVSTKAYSGLIGNIIVSELSPFIGNAGLWIFVLVGFIITITVLFESNNFSMPSFNVKMPKFPAKKEETKRVELKRNDIKKREKRKDEPKAVTVREHGDTAEILIEPTFENIENIEELKASFSNEEAEEIVEIENQPNSFDELSKIEEDLTSAQQHGIIVDELEENKKLLDEIELGKTEKPKDFELPSTSFFQNPPKDKKSKISEAVIDRKIGDLLDKLAMFKIEGDVVRTYTGPVVTTFEFKPAPNVKVSKILNLQDDLAMALKAQTIRIQAPIPGKDVVGIEVPNEDMQTIYIKELLESEIFQNAKSPLTMILGKDIVGKPFVTDLKKLPHLLIAGTTGSGKSVGINAMILSLLYKNSPDNLKLVMIDPKMLEFSMYNDIPHLLTPVITKATDAINALSNMVAEMERRYTLMSKTKTKNIENYNEKAKKEKYDPFPYIVVVIDELADLMMTSGKDVEHSIARLAQMARASGIHLIVATQRPSVDVVTGLIKANLPSRLSYKVGQKVDSKIILDSMGAESLLGRGDMLFTPPGMSGLVRIHAPWSMENEIEKVVEFLKDQREVEYDMNFVKDRATSNISDSSGVELSELDELYEDAKEVVLVDRKTSISYIQRKLRIGYNRAATIVEQLEKTGVLSEANAKGNRDILI